MRTTQPGAIDVLLPTGAGDAREPGPRHPAELGRRAIDEEYLKHPFYGSRRLAQELGLNRKRVQRRAPTEGWSAAHGIGGGWSQAANDARGQGTQDLPVFTAKCGDHAARPGVEHGHHVHHVGGWVRVPDGGAGLVQPVRLGLAVVGDAGRNFLFGGTGRGVGHQPAGDFQYGSGISVHEHCVHGPIGSEGSRSAWPVAAGRWTTCSASGCGGP